MNKKQLFLLAALLAVGGSAWADQASTTPPDIRYIKLVEGCTGAVMEPMPRSSNGEFWMTGRKDVLPGLFPVIQDVPRWGEGSRRLTLCATKEQIAAYVAFLENQFIVHRKEIEAEHRGFIASFAHMRFNNLPPEQRTPEKRAALQKEIENAVADEIAKDVVYRARFNEALCAAVAAMELYEKTTGLPSGPR